MLQVELTKILGQAADTVDKPRDRKAQRCTSGSPLTNGAICRDGTCSSGASINCAVRVAREVVSASLHTHVANCPPLQAAHEACDNSSRLSGALTCLTCRLFMQYFEYRLSVAIGQLLWCFGQSNFQRIVACAGAHGSRAEGDIAMDSAAVSASDASTSAASASTSSTCACLQWRSGQALSRVDDSNDHERCMPCLSQTDWL